VNNLAKALPLRASGEKRKNPIIFGIDDATDSRCFVSVAQGKDGVLTAACANEGCDGKCKPYVRWGQFQGQRLPIFGCKCMALV
jgi:hypothetical protein